MLKVFIRNHIEIMLKTNKGHCPRCILSLFLRCTDSFLRAKRLAVQMLSLLKIRFEKMTIYIWIRKMGNFVQNIFLFVTFYTKMMKS